MSMRIGGHCVVRDDQGRVLLLKREDFRVWVFPGGGGDPDESPADTAIRETREETGVEVVIDDLVGLYTYPDARTLIFVYRGSPVGGALQTSIESLDVRYVSPDDLPDPMLAVHSQRLADALNGERGVMRVQQHSLKLRLLLPIGLALRRLRNRLRGRPEGSQPGRSVIARGALALDGTERVIEIAAQSGELPWDALRAAAERDTGRRVSVTHVLDAALEGDAVIVRFRLHTPNGE